MAIDWKLNEKLAKLADEVTAAARKEADKDAKKKLERSAVELKKQASRFEEVVKKPSGIKTEKLKLLQKFKPPTADAATGRLLEIETAFPQAETWSTEVRKSGAALAALCREIKEATDELPKDLQTSVKAIQKELVTLAKDGRNFIEDTADDLTARLAELKEHEKRLQGLEASEASGGASSPERAKRCDRTRSTLKQLRSGPPDLVIPAYVFQSSEEIFIYVGRDASGGTEATISELVKTRNGEKPKLYKAKVIYRDKCFHFVGPQLGSSTWAPRLQKALVQLIGQKLPLSCTNDADKLQPPLTGDDFDDPLDYVISERPELRERAKRIKALRDKMLRDVDKSGALRNEGSYATILNRIMKTFESCFDDEKNLNLEGAERVLKTIQTDILDPFNESKDDAADHRAEYFDENKRISSRAEALKKDGMRDLQEAIEEIYKDFPDDAPARFPAAKDLIRDLENAMKQAPIAAQKADAAEKGARYVDEWLTAMRVLLTVDKICNDWDKLFTSLKTEATADVEKLKAKAKEAAKKEEQGKEKAKS